MQESILLKHYKKVFSKSILHSFGFFILFSLLFLFFAQSYISDTQASLDETVLNSLDRFSCSACTKLARCISFFGTGGFLIPVYLCLSMYYIFSKRIIIAIIILELALGSLIMGLILKLIFKRPRPVLNHLDSAGGFSFPSGHSLGAFTLSGILIFLLWKSSLPNSVKWILYLLSIFAAIAVGLSRIYLHVHYASDVIGSLCATIIWFMLYHIYMRLID
jgi:undecaprenyl-diphosphatase